MEDLRLQRCVYCANPENLTDEHAPPKLIFPKTRPSDLITVKACLDCNQGGSKDAEYFRLSLCVNPICKDVPSVKALKDPVHRSLTRPEAQGFRIALLRCLEPEQGMIAFTVNIGRIHAVIKRTVQCLYLHEVGEKLPDTYEVGVVSLDSLAQFAHEEIQEFRRDFVEPLCQTEQRLIADNQFGYSVMNTSRPFVSVWALVFYGVWPFVALTGPKNRITDSERNAHNPLG